MYLACKEEGRSKAGKSRLIKSVREAFKLVSGQGGHHQALLTVFRLAVASIPEDASDIDEKLYA